MQKFDVIIVGGGVVGSAIARELARYRLSIAVLEKNRDVCFETSGRNSAVLHGGFAYNADSLKAECCLEGNLEFDQVARDLDVPFHRTGKLLVGNTDEDYKNLEKTLEQGRKIGCPDLRLIDRAEIDEIEPHSGGKFALYSPHSGIMDPFQYVIGLAENAVQNGAKYFLNHMVTGILRDGDRLYQVQTTKGNFAAKWIINAAAMGGAKIAEMTGFLGYENTGGRGAYIILDKNTGDKLKLPIYPVPNNRYMGVHVTPTTDGNVIVGPTGDETTDLYNYGVDEETIRYLAKSASIVWPHIFRSDYIRTYSGNCPKWYKDGVLLYDFEILHDESVAPNVIHMVNMDSPALTSALPLARRAVKILVDKEHPEQNTQFDPTRKGITPFSTLALEEQQRYVRENPDYGEIICRCEKITKAEIMQAIHNPLGADTLTSVKYRTRSMMGRCQGGYCQMRIVSMIAEELNIPLEAVQYGRQGSYLFVGRVRD